MSSFSTLKIAIVGRQKDTVNYEKALSLFGVCADVLLSIGSLHNYDGLLLPGGGDITPAFYGQRNTASYNIDTELDILQFQALEIFAKNKRPVLGICKGLQIINIFFGGDLHQELNTAATHKYMDGDQYHLTAAAPDNILYQMYGAVFETNSAHHQGIRHLGKYLTALAFCGDGVMEGISHQTLPILGVQWHPERMILPSKKEDSIDGSLLFEYFLSTALIS